MTYSMLGFGVTGDCEGASASAGDFKRADGDMKSSCAKAIELRQKINRLKPIVEEQKGVLASETTLEQVELFQAQKALPAANEACEESSSRRREALKRFTSFAASGCFEAGGAPPVPPPVRIGETTVEHVRGDGKAESKTPAAKPPTPKYAGPRYSIEKCSPSPARTQPGQKGQAVFCWQRFLMAQGMNLAPYGADGDHREITESASKEFEARQSQNVVVEPPKPVEPARTKTASMLPGTILGIPANYALAGAAALLIGGAVFYMKSQEEGAES